MEEKGKENKRIRSNNEKDWKDWGGMKGWELLKSVVW